MLWCILLLGVATYQASVLNVRSTAKVIYGREKLRNKEKPARLYPCSRNICYNHNHVFLSGVNQAWVSYGYDWGKNQYQYRKSKFQQVIQGVHNNGGNSIRVWVHVEGQTSPQFDSTGHVTVTDSSNSLIRELEEYLTYAKQHNVFVFLTLWNGALRSNGNEKLQGLIQDTNKLQSYITHALVPMVNALKHYPALGGWDIMNEPEGVIKPDDYNHEHCFDTRFLHNSGAGWAGKIYHASELQRFINWQADAIMRADPQTMVTVGSWNPKANTDQFGMKNLYSDTCLRKAGGRHAGVLNFYSTHSYDYNRKFDSVSPFHHSASDYGLNKPLVVAEFNQVRGGGMSINNLFSYIYNHGYAGAWSWHANADGSDTDTFSTQETGMRAIRGHTNHGAINFNV